MERHALLALNGCRALNSPAPRGDFRRPLDSVSVPAAGSSPRDSLFTLFRLRRGTLRLRRKKSTGPRETRLADSGTEETSAVAAGLKDDPAGRGREPDINDHEKQDCIRAVCQRSPRGSGWFFRTTVAPAAKRSERDRGAGVGPRSVGIALRRRRKSTFGNHPVFEPSL